MLKLNAKVLNLGMEPGYNPYQHVAEFLYGVPYRYNKLLNVKCFKKGKKINQQFFSHVRYLDLKWNYDMEIVNKELKKNKVYKATQLGSGKVYCFYARKYLELVLKLLKKTPRKTFFWPQTRIFEPRLGRRSQLCIFKVQKY